MKQNLLLSAIATLFLSGSVFSQGVTSSFELSEGFTVGQLNGQKNWENWGYVFEENSNVLVSDLATHGSNIAEVTANDDFMEYWGGLLYPLPYYERMSISADIYLEDIENSDYDMLSLYVINGDEYEYISGFYFNFSGTLEVGSQDSIVEIQDWKPKQWHNVKANVNFETKKIDLYFNNVKVHTVDLPAGVSKLDEVDFEFDNYFTGFKVDNFKVQDLDNLSVSDLEKKDLKMYPNPAKDVLNIDTLKNIEKVTINDMTGRAVLESNSKNINIEALKAGAYIVTIKTSDKVYTQKLIKK